MVINFVLKKKHLYNVYNIFSIDRWRFYAPIVLSVLEMSPRVLAHFRIYTCILSYYHYTIIVVICAFPTWRTLVRDVFPLLFFLTPPTFDLSSLFNIILIFIRRVSMRFESSPGGHTNQTVNYFLRSFFHCHASRSGTCRVPSRGLRRSVAHAIHKCVYANERPRLP